MNFYKKFYNMSNNLTETTKTGETNEVKEISQVVEINEPEKKLNKLQAILQQQKEAQTQENTQIDTEIRKEEMEEIVTEIVNTKPKKKIKYKYKRITLYLSYEDDAWTKEIGKKYTKRTKTKITKSLLYSAGLKHLQKLEEQELENLLIEEAKKRAIDLI